MRMQSASAILFANCSLSLPDHELDNGNNDREQPQSTQVITMSVCVLSYALLLTHSLMATGKLISIDTAQLHSLTCVCPT